MQRLIEQLQRREVQTLKRRVSLAEIAARACERCQGRSPLPACGGVVEDAWIEADPERLTMIVEHVIRNAQDATPEGGTVTVAVAIDGGPGAETAVPQRRVGAERTFRPCGRRVSPPLSPNRT
jgi:signal transduction histidine kinase